MLSKSDANGIDDKNKTNFHSMEETYNDIF